ncbi:MAG: FAD-dependent oxidoreductase [Candidatus Omnitrophota bacterium]
MNRKKICILGAGLSGLSAGWHLRRKGIVSRVFEKEQSPGGLCRSKLIGGFSFDYDGHLLHFKHPYAQQLISRELSIPLVSHERNAWVYTHGVFSKYPFQANLYGLPPEIAEECLLGFIQASKRKPAREHARMNFKDWIHLTMGPGIARHFMEPYNKKFWTVDPRTMTCEWLDAFIPVPSLQELIEGTLQESPRRFGYNATFWYPRSGSIQQIPEAFARGLDIGTSSEVTSIDPDKKEITLASGERHGYDTVISTLALPELSVLIKGIPRGLKKHFSDLNWNSVLNINLGVDKTNSGGKHWVYFPEKKISFFRVGFPHNFSRSSAPKGKHSLYAEISYPRGKPWDKESAVKRVILDLKAVGILESGCRVHVQDVNYIKYGYTIYDNDYRAALSEINTYCASKNIILCGRYGSWRYFSMEDSILDGKRAADCAEHC